MTSYAICKENNKKTDECVVTWLGLAEDSVFRLRWRPVPSPSRIVVRAAVYLVV